MRVEKTVTVRAVKAKPKYTKTVAVKVCDFCGADLPDHGSYGWYPSCSVCKRDCCRKHNSPDPDTFDDHPDWYCDICLPLIIPAKREMKERHWDEKEELEKQIREESLKIKK